MCCTAWCMYNSSKICCTAWCIHKQNSGVTVLIPENMPHIAGLFWARFYCTRSEENWAVEPLGHRLGRTLGAPTQPVGPRGGKNTERGPSLLSGLAAAW
jgi:hypothetical protein